LVLSHKKKSQGHVMTARIGAALLGVSVLLGGCTSGDGASYENAALDTGDQMASYGIGFQYGGQLSDARDRLDRMAFMRGFEDALQGNEQPLSRDEIQTALQTFSEEIAAVAQAEETRVAEANAAEGVTYLAENGARDGVITTESGLQYEVLRTGDGPSPTREQTARLHYRGTLIDGSEFDSSYARAEPAEFDVGRLIAGFTEALTLMQVGSHFRVVIPSDIGYGVRGGGGGSSIGPNATLIFEIELLEIID